MNIVECEYFVGLDLGQKQDHTAIAIVERQDVLERGLLRLQQVRQAGVPRAQA